MPIVLQLRVHKKDIEMNPDVCYIKTIHEKETISEKNILTIRIKKSLVSHWSDSDFDTNSEKITEDMDKISSVLRVNGIVILPLSEVADTLSEVERGRKKGEKEDLSEVEERCPKTKEFIEKQIGRLMKYGEQTKSSA
jgi:hypothetical protein